MPVTARPDGVIKPTACAATPVRRASTTTGPRLKPARTTDAFEFCAGGSAGRTTSNRQRATSILVGRRHSGNAPGGQTQTPFVSCGWRRNFTACARPMSTAYKSFDGRLSDNAGRKILRRPRRPRRWRRISSCVMNSPAAGSHRYAGEGVRVESLRLHRHGGAPRCSAAMRILAAVSRSRRFFPGQLCRGGMGPEPAIRNRRKRIDSRSTALFSMWRQVSLDRRKTSYLSDVLDQNVHRDRCRSQPGWSCARRGQTYVGVDFDVPLGRCVQKGCHALHILLSA